MRLKGPSLRLRDGALIASSLSDKVLRILVPFVDGSFLFEECQVIFRSWYVATQIMCLGREAATAATLLHVLTQPRTAAAPAGAFFEPSSLSRLWQGGAFRVRFGAGESLLVAGQSLAGAGGLGQSWKHLSQSEGSTFLSLLSIAADQIVYFANNDVKLLGGLSLGQYGVPTRANFTLVDYLLLVDGHLTVFFNATVATDHELKEDKLVSLLENLPAVASRNVAFFFVVPEATLFLTNFKDFRLTAANKSAVRGACETVNSRLEQGEMPFDVRLGVLAVPMPASVAALATTTPPPGGPAAAGYSNSPPRPASTPPS